MGVMGRRERVRGRLAVKAFVLEISPLKRSTRSPRKGTLRIVKTQRTARSHRTQLENSEQNRLLHPALHTQFCWHLEGCLFGPPPTSLVTPGSPPA